MGFALTAFEDLIYIQDSKTKQQSRFNRTTGQKLSGDLDIPAEEVLYMAWKQLIPDHFTETQLRDKYKNDTWSRLHVGQVRTDDKS